MGLHFFGGLFEFRVLEGQFVEFVLESLIVLAAFVDLLFQSVLVLLDSFQLREFLLQISPQNLLLFVLNSLTFKVALEDV